MILPLPDYRLIGAIPLAYILIVSGALIRHKHLQLHTDLSYGVYIYAFPLQQMLLIAGLNMRPLLFTAISTAVTLPVAALSWFVIEKPALSLKRRLERREVSKVQHELCPAVTCADNATDTDSAHNEHPTPTTEHPTAHTHVSGGSPFDTDNESGT